uniref:WD_REPEATS_REGION domain-containing protein n=1 Tax=Meloidogyne incognita TaxID=6306 RepID=A0A914MFA8_MELIC
MQFSAHDSRVLCLDWHPHCQMPNSFFTSANDSTLKLWNMSNQQNSPTVVSVAQFSAWRLVFSFEGQELAALALPPVNALALYSNYGLENPRLLRGIERDTLMDAAWLKSTNTLKSTTKFLYTLSNLKHKLCRHAIAYEFSNELRDEMSTPILQTKADEESDRLVAVSEQRQHSASELERRHFSIFEAFGAENLSSNESDNTENYKIGTSLTSEFEKNKTFEDEHVQQQHSQMDEHKLVSPTACQNLALETEEGSVSPRRTIPASASSSSLGPIKGHQHPLLLVALFHNHLYSEWQRWIKAPNTIGGDLLTELEALRKHTTEGLYTTEVNFTRAAIAFSYMHYNRYRKINLILRFHREFIDNGLVFVDILQNDSPFTSAKASLFLTLLQQECDEQFKITSDQTVLCRVLKQLPKIIDLMKVFGPPPSASSVIDTSNQYPSKASSQSDSTGDERNLLASLAAEATERGSIIFGESDTLAPNHKQLEALPCSYKPSPYDSRVPTPRNCGARFNRYLVAFGIVDHIYIRKNEDFCGGVAHQSTVDDRREERSIPRIVPMPASMRGVQIEKSGGIKSDGIRPQQSESQSPYPRSLAEYCIFVNPTPPSCLRQSSSTWNGSFQYSPPIRSISYVIPPTIAHGSKPHSISESMNQLCSGLSGEYQKKVGEVESLRQSQQQQKPQFIQISQQRPIISDSRIFGTSPNSSSIIEPYGHSFSLQNVMHSIRHRGNSMSSALPQTTVGDTSSSVEQLTTSSTFHKQSIDENLFLGLAAVMPEQVFNSTVLIYDASTLLPISQPLAKTYKLLGDNPSEICRHNFEQVLKYGCGRSDLLALWQFLEQLISYSKPFSSIQSGDNKKSIHLQFGRLYKIESAKILRAARSVELTEIPWNSHPLGRELINRLLEHYVSKSDLQTAAVIICLFNITKNNNVPRSKIRRRSTTWTDTTKMGIIKQSKTTEDNNINIRPTTKTIPTSSSSAALYMQQNISSMPITTISEHNVTAIIPQHLNRKTSAASNTVFSANAPLDQFYTTRGGQYVEAITSAKPAITTTAVDRLSPSPEYLYSSPKPKTTYTLPARKERNNNLLSLDPTLSHRFNEVKRIYADILYRWRMYKKCAEVLKHCDSGKNDESIEIIKTLTWCHFCGQQRRGDSFCCIKGRRTSSIICSICERPCKGIVTTCVTCSHGGHLAHLATWFDTQSQCPLGCGCECKF